PVLAAAIGFALVFGVVAAGATSVVGSITAGDPTHSPGLDASPPASTCSGSKPTPGTLSGAYHYDSYSFTNTTAGTQCETVTLTTPAASDLAFVSAYLTSFDPTNPRTNYLADPG